MRLLRASIAVFVAALALAGSPERARSQVAAGDDPWASGSNWISLRAGYAKGSGRFAGNGGIGYGFGYSRMLDPMRIWRWTLFKRWSLGAYVHYENVDHFFNASEIEIPASVELVRHFNWKTQLRPYLGFGAGPFYHKAYRSGDDRREIKNGGYFLFGANAPVGGRQLLGFDVRAIRLDTGYDPPNPVFGPGSGRLQPDANGIPVFESRKGTHWSAKLNYTLTY